MGFSKFHRKLVCLLAVAVYCFALSLPALAVTQTGAQQQNSSANKTGQMIDTLSGIFAIGMGGFMIATAHSEPPGSQRVMQMAMGGMMILTGLGQLANAAQMGKDAAASDSNVTSGGSLAQTPTNLGSQSLPTVDPSLLTNSGVSDKLKQAGIDPGILGSALQGGATPASAISQASGGKIPAADIQSAMDSAGSLSPDQQKDLLAKSGLADMQAKIAAGIGAADGAGGLASAAKSGDNGASSAAFTGAEEAAKPTDAKISKEVADALAAKEKKDQLNGLGDLSIFQQVHKKYSEKFGLIYGHISNGAALKGVAGVDGKPIVDGVIAPAAAPSARQPASLQ